MTKAELEQILKQYEQEASDGAGGYDTVIDRQDCLNCMVEAYNKGVSDTFNKVVEATVLGTDVRYLDLKIKE